MRNFCLSILSTLALISCAAKAEPFVPQLCKLEVETRLAFSFREDSWQLEKNYYPSLLFETQSGNIDLLDKYLKLKGYFPVAMDPNDPKSKTLRSFSVDGADEVRRQMATPNVLSVVACDASYVSGAKLKSVWVMSGSEPAFKVDFK